MAGGYQVEISKRAQGDLDAILHYLLRNQGKTSAIRTYEAIIAKFEVIARMPTAYPEYKVSGDTVQEVIRWTTAKKRYKIFFTVQEDNNGLLIVRVKHVKSSHATIKAALEEE